MKLLETIYCSQYYELKKMGKDPMKARLNGTLLSAVVILLLLMPFILIVNHYFPHNFIYRFLSYINNGMGGGKFAGKVLGLACLAIIAGLLYLTIGSKKNYESKMVEWSMLPETVLQKSLKTSLVIFFCSFAFFVLVIVGTNFV